MNQEIKDDEAPFKMKDGVTAYSKGRVALVTTFIGFRRLKAKLGFLF